MNQFVEIRYGYDNPSHYGLSERLNEDFDASDEIMGGLLSDSVRIVPSLFPDIAKELEGLNKRMMLERDIDCFVTSNPSIQAYCIPIKSGEDGHFVVVVTSALIERLNSKEIIFVIGHEVGHFIYQHWRHPKGNEGMTHGQRLAMLQLERAAEISADRVGMIACRSLHASCTAMIKVASGLSEPFLKPDIPSLLRQFRELIAMDGHEAAIFSTHPTIPLRIRALLRFDPILKVFKKSGEVNPSELEGIDQKVDDDFHKSTGNALKKLSNAQFDNVKLWGMVSIFVADGIFSKSEQKLLGDQFGETILKKVIGFLKTNHGAMDKAVSRKLKKACSEVVASHREKRVALVDELNEIFYIEEYTGDCEIRELERIKDYLDLA